jgi:hypothetical protein
VAAGELVVVVVVLSVVEPDGLAAGATVSVFCSQPTKRAAAPARMQMYFFIMSSADL